MTQDFQTAIAPGRISVQVSEHPAGSRRYVLQVPQASIPVAQACVEDLMNARYQRQVAADQDVVSAGIAAFHRLLERVKHNWHTGQSRRIVSFLAWLYNGTDYPLDLRSCGVWIATLPRTVWYCWRSTPGVSGRCTATSRMAARCGRR